MEDPQQQEDEEQKEDIVIQGYQGERDINSIMVLVGRDLSEPYSIFTYRYFLHGWPELCFLVSNRKFHEKQHKQKQCGVGDNIIILITD